MKKIAVFLADLEGGGAERVMLNIANGFVSKGVEVDLLLVKSKGPYLAKLDPNIRLISFDTAKLVLSFPKLFKYLKKERPNILITALEDTNLIAILAHLMARVPTRIVVTVHNNLTQESKHLQSLKRRFVPYLIKWFYPFSDWVISVSYGVAKDLESLGLSKEKIKVIYNPIITPDFIKMANAIPEHPWFDIVGSPIILGVGRLDHQKDFETLIKAYSLLRKKKNSRLMILGQGSQHKRLLDFCKDLSLSEDDVTFPGFVDNPFSYMSHAAVCVLSSAWEGFGNVLVESMGAGTPVVSTNCPSGPAEILENGKYGALVPVGDAECMAEAILKTLDNPIQSSILQRRAKDFRLEKILDEYQELLFD
ncbi:MAG: glycosyltransferase [Cyanobacteria bacterium P01_G01_bin.49]